ncbi:hypothetical protein [Paenibacillus sp. Leaf72]|uniref:hypothetical protein n=1 Tax=Paenibacillus sp. Leaf72 TaxID=1736234 RepID=UPI0006FAB26D|nr:hypothetical protein [Paenibacillus sp. Leaf72]KQO18045.1 hypothetical protein ASF12_05205 [Paenibacillus sp. Leaf72]
MPRMNNRRIMAKHYAQGVIAHLNLLGYHDEQAKLVFFRHYREMKRIFGLEPNVGEFAKLIDEFERAIRREEDNLKNPNYIKVGPLHERLIKLKSKQEKWKSTMAFELTESMLQKIKEWDSCHTTDATEAKFAYIFIPTGLGIIIKVTCDICNRVLDLTDDFQ